MVKNPLQGQFPCWGSYWLEYGLNNLSWDTRSYELCPLRGHTHSFHNSGQGWKKEPPCLRVRRFCRMGISHAVLLQNSWKQSNAEQGGGLTDEASAMSVPWHPAPIPREKQKGHCEVSRDANKSTWGRPNFFQICSITSVWSFHSPWPQPLSRQDICFLICKRSPTYCLCALAHDGLSGLGESILKLEILPGSPGNWCATWDGDLPTDLGRSGHSWPLPSPWGRRPSLALHDDMEPPTQGLVTGTTVSSTCLRHISISAWPWSCKIGCPSEKTLWSWATTARVSCAAGQSYHVGRSCHQTQQLLKEFHIDKYCLHLFTLAYSHSLDCREDRLDSSRRQTCLHWGRIPHHAQISGPL